MNSPGCAPLLMRPKNQTKSRRGGLSRAEGTMDVIAASAIACREEASGGTWMSGSGAGGAAAPTQQLAQVAHLVCEETTLEPGLLQCPASFWAAA